MHLGRHIFERFGNDPQRVVATFLKPGSEPDRFTALRMAARAAALRGCLDGLDIPERALIGIVHRPGPDLHAAWLAALWNGHVPTMLAPPSPAWRVENTARDLRPWSSTSASPLS